MTERIVVVGAGGHAREVLDVIEAINRDQSTGGRPRFQVLGVVADPAPSDGKVSAYGIPYLGSVEVLGDFADDVSYVIGIGSSAARRDIDAKHRGRPAPVLVHPSATLGREVQVEPGAVVCSHVSVTNHIRIGRHSHLNRNSTVGHDSLIGDFATISPLVAISGNVQVEQGALLGTGATVNPGVRIGAWSVVGANAAVVRDVPAGLTVVGVPAMTR